MKKASANRGGVYDATARIFWNEISGPRIALIAEDSPFRPGAACVMENPRRYPAGN